MKRRKYIKFLKDSKSILAFSITSKVNGFGLFDGGNNTLYTILHKIIYIPVGRLEA